MPGGWRSNAAVYNATHQEVGPTRAEIITEDSFAEWRDAGPVHLLGNGAEKCREILTHPNFHYHSDIQPSARELGPLAVAKYETGQVEDLAYFEPFYLKDFIVKKKG